MPITYTRVRSSLLRVYVIVEKLERLFQREDLNKLLFHNATNKRVCSRGDHETPLCCSSSPIAHITSCAFWLLSLQTSEGCYSHEAIHQRFRHNWQRHTGNGIVKKYRLSHEVTDEQRFCWRIGVVGQIINEWSYVLCFEVPPAFKKLCCVIFWTFLLGYIDHIAKITTSTIIFSFPAETKIFQSTLAEPTFGKVMKKFFMNISSLTKKVKVQLS